MSENRNSATDPPDPSSPVHPTRLHLSTTLPGASLELGRSHSFEGVKNLTSTGRFTTWSGGNFYAASNANTYLTAKNHLRLVAGADVSVSADTTAEADDASVSGASGPIGMFRAGDGDVMFGILAGLTLAQSIGGLVHSPPAPVKLVLTGTSDFYGIPLLAVVGVGLGLGLPFGAGFMAPAALASGAKSNLTTHATFNSIHTAKGDYNVASLGSFSASALIMASVTTPGLASLAGGLSASVQGGLVAEITSIALGTEVGSRLGPTDVFSMNNETSLRGTSVRIGSAEDRPWISPKDLYHPNAKRAAFAMAFGGLKKIKKTDNVHVESASGIDLKTGHITLQSKTDDEDGVLRVEADRARVSVGDTAVVNVKDSSLRMESDESSLAVWRLPSPTLSVLEEQIPVLNALRDAGLEAANLKKSQQLAAAAATYQQSLGAGALPNLDDLNARMAQIFREYREAVDKLWEAHLEGLRAAELVSSSGLRVAKDTVTLHAGATHITLDTASGSVKIEQTAPGTPTSMASISIENGEINLQSQTRVNIDAGGQSFSFGPTGYTGPSLTSLP